MSDSADRVPFNDLSRTPADVLDRLEDAARRVIRSGWYVMGPEHDAFEQELAAYAGGGEAVALGNGTDALEFALAALGVRPGSRVLTAANAGGYTSVAARVLGAVPVYCDVDADTLLMTPATVSAALESLDAPPAAIVVTHLYGAMAPVREIVAFADGLGIPVIEDCAQSFGARVDGRAGGTFGAIATASFYPTKNLGALGDGGAVLTSDPELAATVRRMRQYGWDRKYHVASTRGRNSRMDELQAAMLRVRLPLLDAANERRRDLHAKYEAATGRMVHRAGESFIAHLAVAAVPDRDGLRRFLDEHGITTDVHYPIPDHWQDFPGGKVEQSLPVTERAAASVLSLPMFPELTDAEADRVAEALREYGDG
jgi:dTDP-4-amino-4,6-dideoxygalactose transaminase